MSVTMIEPMDVEDEVVDKGEIGDLDPIWIVRTTGEMFKTYQDYIHRIAQLRRPVFDCTATGRSGLRFEETLLGNRLIEEQLGSFPTECSALLLSHTHHSTEKLRDLVNVAFKLLGGAVSRQIIRLKIKQSTSRPNFSGAPWIVHDELIKEHGIEAKPLPADLQEIVSAWKTGKPFRRRLTGVSSSAPAAVLEDASDKFPIEDTKIPGYDNARPPNLVNVPKWTVDPSLTIFQDLFSSWTFLRRFANDVLLSPFSFEQWLAAIFQPESSRIFLEVSETMVHLIVTGEPPIEPDGEIDVDQLVQIMEQYNEEMSELMGSTLRHMDVISGIDSVKVLFSVRPEIRAFILRTLCDRALSTDRIRQTIDTDVANRQEMKQSHRAQIADEKKSLKNQRAVIKQEKASLALGKTINYVEQFKLNSVSDDSSAPKSRQKFIAEQKQLKAAQDEQRAHEMEQIKAESRIRFLETKYESSLKDCGRNIESSFFLSLLRTQVRCAPLGLDRYKNEYFWIPEAQGIMFVARPGEGIWGFYDSPSQIEDLFEFLNDKGKREAAFREKLKIMKPHIVEELQYEFDQKSSPAASHPVKRKTRAKKDDDEEDGAWTNKYRRMSQ